mmetsp:Transcript_76595/g.212782  ORF Transcript_76595/g.212782 Transcript_76595/m.212782 type:complete len:545 (-) Transcript_76595:136-1770(-)
MIRLDAQPRSVFRLVLAIVGASLLVVYTLLGGLGWAALAPTDIAASVTQSLAPAAPFRAAVQAKVCSDPVDVCGALKGYGRPHVHFTASRNWINDPNGLVHYDGEYHLFFQHNPSGNRWGNMSWGHAVSPDLLHWTPLPLALAPDGEDQYVFSGSAVMDWKNASGLQTAPGQPPMVAIYTSASATRPYQQRLAFSIDRGRTFSKLPGAVVDSFRPQLRKFDGSDARDPKVQWHAPSARWIMVLWIRTDGRRQIVGLFSSSDLLSWTKLQDISFEGGDLGNYKGGFECPDLFELPVAGEPASSRRWVLWSANGAYLVGTFDGFRFNSNSPALNAEYGQGYAAQTFDGAPGGRRVQLSWLRPSSVKDEWRGEPFRGQMTFPVSLELVRSRDGLLVRRLPVPELTTLRRSLLLAAKNEALDMNLTAELSSSGAAVEVWLGRSRSSSTLSIQLPNGELRMRSDEVYGHINKKSRRMPLLEKADRSSEILVLADQHSVEVFDTTGGASMSLYAPRSCESRVTLRSTAPTDVVEELRVYELRPSSCGMTQ